MSEDIPGGVYEFSMGRCKRSFRTVKNRSQLAGVETLVNSGLVNVHRGGQIRRLSHCYQNQR